MIAALLLAMISLAGCASNSPSNDDESAAQMRCAGDYRLKCSRRTGEATHCNCVPPGEVEDAFDAFRTFGVNQDSVLR